MIDLTQSRTLLRESSAHDLATSASDIEATDLLPHIVADSARNARNQPISIHHGCGIPRIAVPHAGHRNWLSSSRNWMAHVTESSYRFSDDFTALDTEYCSVG
jgi:hypothetical protein